LIEESATSNAIKEAIFVVKTFPSGVPESISKLINLASKLRSGISVTALQSVVRLAVLSFKTLQFLEA
jgi:hypothetical protein